MTADATYIMGRGPAVMRTLHPMGRWDEALGVLPADALTERAEILVDRYW